MVPLRPLILLCASLFLMPLAAAEATEDVPLRFSYVEGEDNILPGCQAFIYATLADPEATPNPCHAIATSMNHLDSPKIDVLLMVPAGPMAERDLRIMRQSTQMWADGIHWMAHDMGFDWLADTVEFRISTQIVDEAASGTVEYAIADPEIVLIAANPGPGLGIGIDPQYLVGASMEGYGMGSEMYDEGPCHGIQQPFSLAAWKSRPGFDDHHGDSGTYVEDCDGAGGNICFSVNGAIDPETSMIDFFQLYDLVSHETGHCLTLGHVGDGAEGSWASVPTNDIMAYSQDPPGISKCVSSLNVEAFVVAMSEYIDTNGDGVVDGTDRIWANDAEGEGDEIDAKPGRPFQIQHPDNHYYASSSRSPLDCPQPDMSAVPLNEVLDFTPEAGERAYLTMHGRDMTPVAKGHVNFAGSVVGEIPERLLEAPLPAPSVHFDDDAGDATADFYDIRSIEAQLADGTLTVAVQYAELRPDNGDGYAQYSLRIDDGVFHAFSNRDYAVWDHDAATITWTFDVDELAEGVSDTSAPDAIKRINAPYNIQAYVYLLTASDGFDYAPAQDEPRLLVGDPLDVSDAPYVLLSAPGVSPTKVPIRPDGTWTGNLDLGAAADQEPAVVSATWYTAAGHPVDSDRVAVLVDSGVAIDATSLRGADAGPGSGEDALLPAPGLLVVIAGLVASVALRRR